LVDVELSPGAMVCIILCGFIHISPDDAKATVFLHVSQKAADPEPLESANKRFCGTPTVSVAHLSCV
jgi:hypothetical protein